MHLAAVGRWGKRTYRHSGRPGRLLRWSVEALDMNIRALGGSVVVCAVLGFAAPASASFHFMQIEQVIGGVNGDLSAQAIQLRMRSVGQNLVGASRVRAWDANGMNPVLIVDMTVSVPSGAAGARVLIASPGFAAHTSPAAVPNFMMTSLIPPSYLAAGSLTFEDDFGTPFWRLSWGGAGYAGTGAGTNTNDADGNFNPPFPGPMPTSCNQAILFTGAAGALSTNNAANYILTAGAATFNNNAGASFMVVGCAGPGDCNDGVACTTDACVLGCCTFTPNDGSCDNGQFCDGVETCSSVTGCTSPGNPCGGATPICVESTDTCAACSVNADCNDSVACTVDTCSAGSCVFTPNNAACPPNGAFCDGVEFCNASLGCLSPGDPCGPGTTCDEPGDLCVGTGFAIALEEVAGGLTSPTKVTHSGDGTGRRFVVEQTGQIRIIDASNTLLPVPFLDISGLITPLNAGYDERGLLGLAFHPNFAVNGRFFVRYSKPRTSTGSEPCDLDPFITGCHSEVLAEFHVLGDPLTNNVADASSEIILFAAPKPQWNHNGGDVAFGPDGFLYTSFGDGGGANDGLADVPPSHGPNGFGQDIDSPLGKVLRLDVDGGAPYAIPPTNPFAATPGLDEIYAYGFRNPYQFSFDRATGKLYLGDVGQDLYEEVDEVVLGGNYGWVIREGFHCFDPFNPTNPPVSCPTTGALGEPLLDPLSEYPHSTGGLAVVGGYVYRGTENPDLVGQYIYGDFSADFGPTGRLYYFDPLASPPIDRQILQLPDNMPLGKVLKGFGEDEDGEIYVCVSDNLGPSAVVAGPGGSGSVLRIRPPRATPVFDPLNAKSRTLTMDMSIITASGPGAETAIRVTMVDLQNPNPPNPPCCPPTNFSQFEEATCSAAGEGNNCARWVGPLRLYLENPLNAASGSYRGSFLQCTPYYHDWEDEGEIHVFGPEIMPSSTYAVQALRISCAGSEDTCLDVSDTVVMTTRRAGDVAVPYNPPSSSAQPDAIDIVTMINKFRNVPGAESKIVLAVQPNVPAHLGSVDALNIVYQVDRFRGLKYPFSGPCRCPSQVACGATPCTSDGQCTGVGGSGAQCVRICVGGSFAGLECITNSHCNLCSGGAFDGLYCDPGPSSCPGGTCSNDATCGAGSCRDACRRCN